MHSKAKANRQRRRHPRTSRVGDGKLPGEHDKL
jgi:hypothetical protein